MEAKQGESRTYEGWGGIVGKTVSESRSWWPEVPRPRDGAPNVIVVLLDDMGFSDIGPFGAEVDTPTLDRLARDGLRYTNYHTTPVCSPARAAFLTGLNPHRAGFASVANSDPGFPGYTMEIAEGVPTLATLFRDAGYATFAVGKWHLTRDALMNDAAARRSWPCQQGFDRYYGVLEGLTNLHHPHRLISDNSPVEVDEYPAGYYLTDDITDHAISMIKALRASDPSKPFFCYVAHNAVHGPLQAKPEHIAKYRGRYDGGWDEVREERFRRQLESGLFPAGTEMCDRNSERYFDVGPWEELPADVRALYARYMEVYAAMIESVDENLGRLLGLVEALGELDNTVVVFTSDNGGTAEGGEHGTRSYFKQFIHGLRLPGDWDADVSRDIDLIGGPRALVHYPRGWGMASNTPFRLYKGHTHAGGVRVPFLLSWPAGLSDASRGAVRTEYQYVTDLLPTFLELAGVERPDRWRGQEVAPLDGSSFAGSLGDGPYRSSHVEQYSEFNGNRSFYRDGWKLVTLHGPGTAYDDQEWELYDVRSDPTERIDLAAEHPERVKELAAAWEQAAWDNQVFPMNDFSGYHGVVRRPHENLLEQPVTILAGTPTLERYRSAKLVVLRSFSATVKLSHEPGADGVLLAHGDQGGGYLLYVEEGRLRFAYNEYGDLTEVDAGEILAGEHAIELRADAGEGYRWHFAISADGEERASHPGALMLLGLAPFQGIDVGIDRRSPVSWPVYERHGSFAYGGTVHSVTYVPGEHAPYSPEAVLRATIEAAQAYE
ncbi:MAG: putative arylsulfatase [Acidimicrobiaceae bacterium]|nr:putative arylsulfatase [Acidimicrobiaceae bacterium]